MKISHPIAIKTISLLGSWVLRLWLGTLDYRFAMDDPGLNPPVLRRRGLYMFWHEGLLLPAYTHARGGFTIMVSRHRDGELITQIVRMLRGRTVRGSTTRGGATALLGMMRRSQTRHLAITPDGPRGPRRQMQSGAVYLASRGRMPLIPVGLAVADPWRAPSWDRMVLPRPGRMCRGVVGRAIEVPHDAGREELERYRRLAQQAMDDVQARAERLVAGRDRQVRLWTLGELNAQGGTPT